MSSDGTSDGKGVKPPRTLFSLGRPGAKDTGEATIDQSRVEAVDSDAAGGEEMQYACGACGAILPTGAAFCGECGTPVATDEYFEQDLLADDGAAPGGLLDEAFTADEALPATTEAAAVEATGASASEAPPSEPVAEDPAAGMAPPAAVLYSDPTVVEPLPAPPESGFQVSEPVVGTYGDTAAATGDETLAQFVGADEALPPPGTTDETVVAPPAGDPSVPGSVAGAGVAGAAAGAVTGGWAAGTAGASEMAPPTAAMSPLSELSSLPSGPPAGTGAPDMPYGQGPLETSPKSKTPLVLAGVAAAVVLIVVIGVVLVMNGSKKEDVATTPSSTVAPTTAKATTSSTAASSSTTEPPSSTTTEATTTTVPETTTTVAVVPTPTVTSGPSYIPGTPGQPGTPGLPSSIVTVPPVIRPGVIQASPGSGSTVSVHKNQAFSVTLRNVGGSSATYSLRGDGNGANGGQSGSLAAGASIVIPFTASTAEGPRPGAVFGSLEGIGFYQLTVNILNS